MVKLFIELGKAEHSDVLIGLVCFVTCVCLLILNFACIKVLSHSRLGSYMIN